MFFDDFNRTKRVKPRLFSDLTQGVLCSVLAVVCFIFYKREWLFALLFAACAAIRFWHHSKTEKNKIALKKIMKEYEDDDYEDFEDEEEVGNLSRKERKARYKEYLNEIEDEFPDVDLEDEEVEEIEKY